MLYRSTDGLCRCGAAVQNLYHSASLDSCDKNAPSKPGIEHLVWPFSSMLTTIALYDSSLGGLKPALQVGFEGPVPHLLRSMAALEVPNS
jgi:hypothetical protein